MRFGVKFGVDVPSNPADLAELALGVEALGFHSLWVGDHLVIPRRINTEAHEKQVGGIPFADKTKTDVLDPFLALGYVSTVTQRVRLGLSVLVVPYRDPIHTAKLVSTLDVLTGGRLVIGAGIGWMQEEFEALKLPYKARGEITDEYLGLMTELWTSDNPTFNGKHCSIANVAFLPKPVQRPHPPMWIGGNGVPAMRRVVRHGQGWMPNFVSPTDLEPKVAQLRSMLEQHGRDPATVEVAVGCRLEHHTSPDSGVWCLSSDPRELIESIAKYEKLGVSELVILSPAEPNLGRRLLPLERFASSLMT